MKTYNLKKGNEYDNDAGGTTSLSKIDEKFIDQIIDKILIFIPQFSPIDKQVIFTLNYNHFVPKTGRFLFIPEKNIKSEGDIPWKNVSFMDNSNKTRILYKIEELFFNNFLKILLKIKNRSEYIIKNWIEQFKGNVKKELIDVLNNLKKLDSLVPIENNIIDKEMLFDEMFYSIELIPFSNEELKNIFIFLDSLQELENDENKEFIKFNYLIISKKTLYKIIDSNFSWIIKQIFLPNANDMSIEVPENIYEEISFLNNLDSLKLKNKPTVPFIGVIDSGIELPKTFSNYITFESYIEENKFSNPFHGSLVSSLIIANDEINITHKDNFGNFSIKHFELLASETKSLNMELVSASVSFDHLSKIIPKIIKQNPTIKIWNLSLGGFIQSRNMSITPVAKILDKLAEENDILFIVASGNGGLQPQLDTLNSPADSFNCLSVGSSKSIRNNNIDEWEIIKNDYSSSGYVYGYFKPEVSTFGGPFNYDGSALIGIYNSNFKRMIQGTSFSTPRITRLAAYLYQNGYSPLEIKAKIINECLSNSDIGKKHSCYGYINPINLINDFDLKVSGTLKKNKPILWDIDLTDVTEITMTGAIYIKYSNLLGDEYSVTDLEIDFVKYNKNWKDFGSTPMAKNSKIKKVLKKIASNNGFHKVDTYDKEFKKRLEGKFFSSKKIIINLEDPENNLQNGWTYAIQIRRNNLIKSDNFVRNNEELQFALCINLKGDKLKAREFEERNQNIIEIDANIEIDIDI